MKTITILQYSTKTGKGLYRDPDGKRIAFRYDQLTELIPSGKTAYLKDNGMIILKPSFWHRLKILFGRAK